MIAHGEQEELWVLDIAAVAEGAYLLMRRELMRVMQSVAAHQENGIISFRRAMHAGIAWFARGDRPSLIEVGPNRERCSIGCLVLHCLPSEVRVRGGG